MDSTVGNLKDEENEKDEDMEADEDDDSSEDDEEHENDSLVADKDEKSVPRAHLPDQPLKKGEELVMDEQAYLVYHQANLGPPCLSLDVIPDDLGNDRTNYPLTLYGVAGSQTQKAGANSIIVFKMYNLHATKRKSSDKNDDDSDDEETESEDEEEANSPEKQPKLKIAGIKHPTGCINRVRQRQLGSTSVVAAWSEQGSVSIWSLDKSLQRLEEPITVKTGDKGNNWPREETSPLYKFTGHTCEGYAVNWSEVTEGLLATGDCLKHIYTWKPTDDGSWNVDSSPLVGHNGSVEDIQWSPNEASVMASCSVDKTIRIWDIRAQPSKACMITTEKAHESDVNVIDWNRNEPFIASGGDDGYMKVWDLRVLSRGDPVAVFKHHKGPITSVEWHHTDATVLASSGADDQIALWDLALEKDDEEISEDSSVAKDPGLNDLPPQLLFIHQGMQDIKELHWHKQIPGLILSTSHTGVDVFRTISV